MITTKLREPLDAALGAQLERIERLTLRALQLVAAVGVVLGSVIAATLSAGLGVACAVTSAVFLGWFAAYGMLLSGGRATPALRAVATIVESAVPWVFLLVIALREDGLYAIASWVPPLLFAALMVAYAARLRPRDCLILGAVGACAYPLLYALLAAGRVPTASRELLIVQPAMQVSRAFALLVAGIAGALVAHGMRSAIGRAESTVREQDLFGKYHIVRRIAAGGMAIVFEALYCPEGGFERRVAVKRIHPHLAADPLFVAGFRDEAELSARLAHPKIVQVLDFGRVGDSYFLAMEFVDGMTLHAFATHSAAAQRPLSPAVVGYVLHEVLAALCYAHDEVRGPDGAPLRIVHRDLCPPNVLLSRAGEVKLTDFGIARSLKESGVSMTQHVVGHAGYMAPEQARTGAFDARADLFPVGVIAWELLAGRPLFKRATASESLLALLESEAPPITDERPDVDPRWSPFIARALSREPDGRYPSAAEMLRALEEIGDSSGVSARELGALVREQLALRAPPRDG